MLSLWSRLCIIIKYDVSIPLAVFYDLVVDMRNRLGDNCLRCVGYGHVGDSNLHLVTDNTHSNTSVSLTLIIFRTLQLKNTQRSQTI